MITITGDDAAYQTWQATQTPNLEAVRTAKLAELDAAAQTVITGGCDVTLADGTTGHISLTAEDQINLSTAQAAVQAGAAGYPYHLDGELCKIYAAADILAMQRQDKCSMPASFDEIQFERRETISREYDRAFVDGATVNDLDLNLVQHIADVFLRGMSPEQYLQQVNLAEYGGSGLRLKRAAILLFASDIAKWFPRCQVRILKVEGDEILPGSKYNVISDEYITGNIFTLLNDA